MAIAGLQAGKHVYVEKPCSHNPAEGALLVEAQQKYGKLVQMGTQQRSSPHTIEIVDKIHNGLIGTAVFCQGLVCQHEKVDRDWQRSAGARHSGLGSLARPCAATALTGTMSILITGTGSGFTEPARPSTTEPTKWMSAAGRSAPITRTALTSSGGRYQFKDDWQFYDTLVTSFEYDDKLLSWEGRSCSGMKLYHRDRGALITGTTGSVLVDRDGYEIYDLDGKKTGEYKTGETPTSSADLIGADSMTDAHFANFIAGIRSGEKLHAPISVGNVAVTMLQLSNIAWEMKRELHLDSRTAKIVNDPQAMKLWDREYEPGWAPHL